MKNNIIKDNSVGVQAGRDLTVNQTVNELPDSIQNMFVEILRPSIEQIGKNLNSEISTDVSKSIGAKIRNVLEDGFVKSIKEQIQSQNLNYHIEMVFKKIHEDGTKNQRSKEEIHKTLEKTDLFLEWVESAEDISPKDSIFSKIWQNWLYKLSQGGDNSNHKILLGKMKQLTPEDADLLLRSRRRTLMSFRRNFSEEGKLNYITKKLSDLGLLKRFYYFEFLSFVVSIISIWVFLNIGFHNMIQSEISSKLELPFYLVGIVIPLFFYFLMPNYKLTWLGKEIVSYAYPKVYSFRRKSFENLGKDGVPDEILKKMKFLIYEKFYTENELFEALRKQINIDQLEKYKEFILKHVDSSDDY